MSEIGALLAHPEFGDIDRHFAQFISEFSEGELPAFAAATLSRNMRHGHICLELDGKPPLFEEPQPALVWPDLTTWQKAFARSRAIGGPDEGRPLVLDSSGRLYLRRYWEYEKTLASGILIRCQESAPLSLLKTNTGADLQSLAIETALARRFVVISGGPGTGKTTTVLRILERLVSEPGGEKLRIVLAAPTGKAAARLQESLRDGAGDRSIQERLPKTASTLHRLLGRGRSSVYFRHHSKNPLPVDLVVVDEASMVPLTMMAKLFDALPGRARVILLGDRDQLSSVEPGAVLGDIANAASQPGPLNGSLVVLEKNYRFGNESTIFALSNAIRDGKVERALEILNSGERPDLTIRATPSPSQIAEQLRQSVMAGYTGYLRTQDPAEALKEFKKFRILCPFRVGPYGVESLNRAIEKILREEDLITGTHNLCPGMPVLVTENDDPLRLYNGDIGILLPDPADHSLLLAWFIGEDGGVRRIPPARLPQHEPAFAMTVHKSQGSEFDHVLLILPDKDSPLLTRELVYTGLTRARTRVEV
ncbi:MAG: exodeoxyribonuclease alpha subunit, partial [Verrucomicrobiota bacterium]|nr:exodeoxyribonuclease alpha subunit [Verrucomicrobiota bacterium]